MNNQDMDPRRWPKAGCFFQVCLGIFVIGLLVAIAIPDFIKPVSYKQNNAKANLDTVFAAQVAYFSEYNTYAGGDNCFELLGWAPEGQNLHAYFCGGDFIESTRIYQPPSLSCALALPASSATGFTICASGNIDRDLTLDEWIINDAKQLTNVINDIGN